MKTFKKILIGLVVVLVLIAVVGLFLPGKVHVERSASINSSPDKVFALVGTMKNWELWSPWHKMDPNMKVTYFGPESGLGAGYSWESEKMGNGKLTITGYEPFNKINTDMDFMENGTAKAAFNFTVTTEGTNLSWSMDSDTKEKGGFMNVIGGYFAIFMKGALAKEFDKGLADIKTQAEKM